VRARGGVAEKATGRQLTLLATLLHRGGRCTQARFQFSWNPEPVPEQWLVEGKEAERSVPVPFSIRATP